MGTYLLGLGGGGVYRSTNNGGNWTQIGWTFALVWSLAINSSGHIFAGHYGGGVYRSTDNGEHWTEINSGLTSLTGKLYVLSLAINSSGHVFAALGEGGVFRSTDNGTNWTEIRNGLMHIVNVLAINSSGQIFAGTKRGGVYRSTDNGGNWTQINTGLTNSYVWSLAINSSGHIFAGTDSGVFRSVQSTTPAEIPTSFSLEQNYPNPFNPGTMIEFSVPRSSYVTLKIYDVLGRQVATLVSEERNAGRYKVEWNATGLAGGVYFCSMQAADFIQVRKMLLLR